MCRKLNLEVVELGVELKDDALLPLLVLEISEYSRLLVGILRSGKRSRVERRTRGERTNDGPLSIALNVTQLDVLSEKLHV